jgi:hypothetical protein
MQSSGIRQVESATKAAQALVRFPDYTGVGSSFQFGSHVHYSISL